MGILTGTLLILLIVGIVLITISLARSAKECPKPQTIYRYVPRTFDEEQDQPVYPSQIFATMFTSPEPYIRGIYNYDNRKQELVNEFYISQR